MDTHLDRDAEDRDPKPQHPFRDDWLARLEQRAGQIRALGQSKITGGADGEEAIMRRALIYYARRFER